MSSMGINKSSMCPKFYILFGTLGTNYHLQAKKG